MTNGRMSAILSLFVLAAALACHSKTPHSVTLTWQEAKPRAGSSVVGYNVYRRVQSETQYTKVAGPVAHPPYEDRYVVSGKTYFYSVTAVDASGIESRLSENVPAAIP